MTLDNDFFFDSNFPSEDRELYYANCPGVVGVIIHAYEGKRTIHLEDDLGRKSKQVRSGLHLLVGSDRPIGILSYSDWNDINRLFKSFGVTEPDQLELTPVGLLVYRSDVVGITKPDFLGYTKTL